MIVRIGTQTYTQKLMRSARLNRLRYRRISAMSSMAMTCGSQNSGPR